MKKVYIYFTKLTEAYEQQFENKLFKISYDLEEEPRIGFCREDKKIAFLNYSNQININFTNIHPNSSIILFHDSLDLKDINLKGELLKSIEIADKVFVFHHKSNPNNIAEFKKTIKENKLTFKVFDTLSDSNEQGFSHIENDKTNPFYRLSELWNCISKQEFDDKLINFEGFLKTEEKLKEQALKELKHSVFNTILNNTYLEFDTEKEKLSSAQKDILKENNFKLKDDYTIVFGNDSNKLLQTLKDSLGI